MKRFLAFGMMAACVLAGSAVRADVLQTRTATYTGQVARVEGGAVFIKLQQGEFAVPARDLLRVEVAAPDAYEKGVAAIKAGKFSDAISLLKPLADRFAGLPVVWAMDTLLRLGEAHLDQKDVASAQTAFDMLKKLYPNTPQAQAVDVKNARVLLSLKKYDEAITALKAYLDPQLKKDFLPADQETAVAEALVLMGDVLLGKDKPYEAIDSYLKVVTLYDYDDVREAEARFKTAQVLEKVGNWKRAKECYSDLLSEAPDSVYVGRAKQQIEAITKAHPE